MIAIGKKEISFYAIVLTGALLLLIPAFYNGYPLVNSDDGTYIHSGFLPQVPGDRPIIYGLLLRIFSLNGISLWIALFVQAITVSWLLLKIIKTIIYQKTYLAALAIYCFLAFATSLSWITSELIPDVCTPIVLMSMYLLLLGKESNWNTFVLYGIFLAASGTHISHFVIFMAILLLLFLLKRWLFSTQSSRKIHQTLIILAALSLLANFVNSSVYRNSKHIFFMGSLLDKKILKPYLHESCPSKGYKLCQYKDEIGDDPNWFIWDQNSPLYKEGGWATTKPEYDAIIKDILTSPKYLKMFAGKSALFTWRQLMDFKIGDGNFPFKKDNHVYWAIEQHVPGDIPMYVNAWQHQELIIPKLELPNKIIYIVAGLSLVVIIMLFVLKRQRLSGPAFLLLLLTMLLVLINAWDCATFSNVIGRYQCRVMWMIPFCAMLLMIQAIQARHQLPDNH